MQYYACAFCSFTRLASYVRVGKGCQKHMYMCIACMRNADKACTGYVYCRALVSVTKATIHTLVAHHQLLVIIFYVGALIRMYTVYIYVQYMTLIYTTILYYFISFMQRTFKQESD